MCKRTYRAPKQSYVQSMYQIGYRHVWMET